MINTERFMKNFVISFGFGMKTVHKWTENGQTNYCYSTTMGEYNKNLYVPLERMEDLDIFILGHINGCNYSEMSEHDLIIIDNRICWAQLEDSSGNIIETQEEEIDAIESDDCYICNYDLYVYINGIELIEEELREILSEAE